MNITTLLKNYKTICLEFNEEQQEELRKRLQHLGFGIPENFCSPVIIHQNRTLSFITGFASGILFSQPAEKLKKSGIIKIKFSELSAEDIKSGWYGARNITE